MSRWGPTAVVVALLAGTAVAFATTERQKLEKTPFAVLRVSRAFSPRTAPATIQLKLHHPHLVTLDVVDANDHVVATLADEERFEAGVISFHWRGGVPDGVYRPRVTLDDGRVFTLQNPIVFDTVAPRATLVSYRPSIVRKRTSTRVRIAYRVTEPAHVLLFVNGRRVLRSHATGKHARIEWFASRDGRRLRHGRYRLQLAAVDLAGNIGPRTQAFVVRVR